MELISREVRLETRELFSRETRLETRDKRLRDTTLERWPFGASVSSGIRTEPRDRHFLEGQLPSLQVKTR